MICCSLKNQYEFDCEETQSHVVDATTFKFLISLTIKEEFELYDPLETDNP